MAGASLVRKVIGAVADQAPALTRRATLNIGLDIPGGGRLAEEEVLGVLQRIGAKPVRVVKHQSDTEPTLVIELDRSLAPEQAHEVSRMLQQEAIAQVDETGRGDLFGPGADKWKPFNGDYFIDPTGKRLTQAIMEAGDPNNVPGGVEPDPVLQRLDEIAASLKQEEPAYGKGGLVKEGAKALMRLYHGRSFKEPIKQLDPTISPDQLGIHLGDPETASKFATIRENVRPKDAGARVIPLDVELKNPLRLQDRHGKWRPDDVYEQLVERGLVEFDEDVAKSLKYRAEGMVQDADGSWVDEGSDEAKLDAMLEIQDIIRGLGHDGVVYLNRYEMPKEALERAMNRDPSLPKLGFISDDEFRAEFPEAVDSYIAFRKEQLKSTFGEGPGVGYAGGGLVNKIGKGLVDFLDFSGVAGKPKTVKIPERGEFAAAPIAELDEAAEAYMKKHGIPGTHRINQYPEFDEEFAKRIADEYDRAKHMPNDPAVRRAYDALLDETMEQYRALKDTGLDVRFLRDGMADPYAKSPAMGYADIVDNGRLWVFPSDYGFGSNAAFDAADNPLLKKVGRVGDKEDAVANDAFRVVHDAYGHFGPGNPFFRHQGEDRAWQHHGRMFTDDALPAMTAETRGQNSWLNFGPYGEQNRKALGADTIFADQKATIMPSWVYEKELGRLPKFADGGPVWSEEDVSSMTHDQSYGTGREMNYLDTLGMKVPLGDMNYFDVDDERQKPEGAQALHDLARVGIYAVPGVGPVVGAGLDTTEALATDDPLTAGMAVAFGPGGKKAKAALTGALAYAMDPADAEAGMFGKLAKWGTSSEGRDALFEATRMVKQGADPEEVRRYTGWFEDLDGHWKYELPSAGGWADLKRPGKGMLADYYYDPHLFEQYPSAKDITISRMNDEGASYNPDLRHIKVGDLSGDFFKKPKIGGLKGVLDHEVYHDKANIEGWAQGSSQSIARHEMAKDLARFLKSKKPRDRNIGEQIDRWTPDQRGILSFSRYEADVGEALAAREAARRDLTGEQILFNTPPTNDIAMPKSALFHKNKPATVDQYGALVNWHNSRLGK